PSSASRHAKIAEREPIRLNAREAALRGLAPGDTVRVFNDRGSFISAVAIDDGLRDGVAQIATGAWYDPEFPGAHDSLEKHGNPNVATNDKGTSRLGQSSVAQTALVEIEKWPAPPPVTAFELPKIQEAVPA